MINSQENSLDHLSCVSVPSISVFKRQILYDCSGASRSS